MEITVKAGTFKAFKVNVSWQARGDIDYSGSTTYWYAPAAKRTIKTVDRDSGDIELIEYNVQNSQ